MCVFLLFVKLAKFYQITTTANKADTTPPHCADIRNMPITNNGTESITAQMVSRFNY